MSKQQARKTPASGPAPVQPEAPGPKPVIDVAPSGKPRSARDIRRQRARRLLLRLALWVVLPTALASGYYGCVASAQYESVSVFTVHSDRNIGGLETLAAILPSASSTRDAMIVSEYIRSRDMLDILIGDQGFLEHYRSEDADWLSRLDDEASSEEVYEYYLDHVEVSHSSQSGTLTLRVRAFSAERAQALAQAILGEAEDMVNRMSERARADHIRLAEREVANVEKRLAKAREELLALQGQGADINPVESASAVLAIRSELEGQLASAQADLDALQSVMHSDAPKVLELRARVRSLRAQIRQQNRRLVDRDGDRGDDEGINEDIARFEPAMLEKEFAEKAYAASLSSLELARVEALRQQRYLVTISQPSRPSAPTHPRKAWGIATVFVLALALMIVGTMLGAAVREHAKF